MNTVKMHWVMDVVIAQAKAMVRKEHGSADETLIDEVLWERARGDVKTHAARLLAALAPEANLTFEDYLAYKGKQRG
jgi:hypothetical protein